MDLTRRDLALGLLGVPLLIGATAHAAAPQPDDLQAFMQVCWVVRDLDRSIATWVEAGAGPFYVVDPASLPGRTYRGKAGRDRIRRAAGFMGPVQIELIQSLDDQPSIFNEVKIVGDQSLHHIQPRCRPLSPAEFDAETDRLSRQGFAPAQSLVAPGLGRNTLFDAVARLGFFIELGERPPAAFEASRREFAEHLAWDGRDPIRRTSLKTR